jgi:hypothetical protein
MGATVGIGCLKFLPTDVRSARPGRRLELGPTDLSATAWQWDFKLCPTDPPTPGRERKFHLGPTDLRSTLCDIWDFKFFPTDSAASVGIRDF